MADPCGGPLNLLKDQYQGWWTSVFLTITSECANIPAFSYLGASGLHRVIPPKTARPLRGTISCDLLDWKKPSLINGLTSPPKELPFFTSSLMPGEGRSCGPAAGSRDRQLHRSGPDRGSAVRKTLGLIAGFRLPQKSLGWMALWMVRAAQKRPVHIRRFGAVCRRSEGTSGGAMPCARSGWISVSGGRPQGRYEGSCSASWPQSIVSLADPAIGKF